MFVQSVVRETIIHFIIVVCGRALAPAKGKGDILRCYSSRIEENSPCKNNRAEIAKVEDAIMKTVNMYATVYLDEEKE